MIEGNIWKMKMGRNQSEENNTHNNVFLNYIIQQLKNYKKD